MKPKLLRKRPLFFISKFLLRKCVTFSFLDTEATKNIFEVHNGRTENMVEVMSDNCKFGFLSSHSFLSEPINPVLVYQSMTVFT